VSSPSHNMLKSVAVRKYWLSSASVHTSWTAWNLFILILPIVTGFSSSSVNGMSGDGSASINSITSPIANGGGIGSSSTINSMPPIAGISYYNNVNDINNYLPRAQKALKYFDDSTDPFHAVQTSINLLKQVGFVEIDESDLSNPDIIHTIGKYYYTKNKSTLVAFTVGGQFDTVDTTKSGFVVVGGHTDSPNLRIKPRSKRPNTSAGGCIQLGVECYGGGLWHTWFDRDLGISGRIFVRSCASTTDDEGTNKEIIQQKLVKIDRPLLRISNLAIHLQTPEERKGFTVNSEEHLSPIISMEVKKALTGDDNKKSSTGDGNTSNDNGWSEHQEPALLYLLATELNCSPSDIIDFELNLYDIQKSALGGAFSEFVYSSRLDNLASCFMAVEALSESVEPEMLQRQTDINMIVLYDHEEVGSTSAVGAASPILEEAVEGITIALASSSNQQQRQQQHLLSKIKRNSFVISSDQAHAIHPNYSSKHEKNHQPKMNAGMVIKRNSNQRYATNPVGGVIIREIARKANLKAPQEFIVRQDCGCGSTIGPTISARTGIRTIDMGCPQLSMHSIRETMGTKDLSNGINFFKAYFHHFRNVDISLEQ
jgi:aspartyl aminopeptidase